LEDRLAPNQTTINIDINCGTMISIDSKRIKLTVSLTYQTLFDNYIFSISERNRSKKGVKNLILKMNIPFRLIDNHRIVL